MNREFDPITVHDKVIVLVPSLKGIVLLLNVTKCRLGRYSKVGNVSEETVFTRGLKLGVTGSTIVAIVFLVFYYDAQIKVLRASGVEFSPGFSFISLREARLFWWFVVDFLVLLPQPVPFLQFKVEVGDIVGGNPIVYTSDCILMSLMFMRLWFLPRFVATASVLKQDLAFRMARFYNVDINTW